MTSWFLWSGSKIPATVFCGAEDAVAATAVDIANTISSVKVSDSIIDWVIVFIGSAELVESRLVTDDARVSCTRRVLMRRVKQFVEADKQGVTIPFVIHFIMNDYKRLRDEAC